MPNHLAAPTSVPALAPLKCSRSIGIAMRLPMMIEISTAVWLMKPVNSRLMSTINRMTTAASTMCEIWPESGLIFVATEPSVDLRVRLAVDLRW